MSLCKLKDEFKDKINIKYIYYILNRKQEFIENNYQLGCANKTGAKVGKIVNFFRKVPSGERYLNFLGPAGGFAWQGGEDNLESCMIFFCMFCCWMFFQRALWIHKRVFCDNIGGV